MMKFLYNLRPVFKIRIFFLIIFVSIVSFLEGVSSRKAWAEELIMNEEMAQKLALPPVRFKVSYPSPRVTMGGPVAGLSYARFFLNDASGKVIEELSIGYFMSTRTINFHEAPLSVRRQLMETVFHQLQSQIELGFERVTFSRIHDHASWFGQDEGLQQLEIQGFFKDEDKTNLRACLIRVIPIPPPAGKKNGVLLIFQALEGSTVKAFSDFEKEGLGPLLWPHFGFE